MLPSVIHTTSCHSNNHLLYHKVTLNKEHSEHEQARTSLDSYTEAFSPRDGNVLLFSIISLSIYYQPVKLQNNSVT